MVRVFAAVVALALWAHCGSAPSTPGGCVVDGECPIHQLCEEATGTCVTGCVTNAVCGDGQACGPHGRCFVTGAPDLAVRGTGGELPDLSSEPSDTPDLSMVVSTVDLGDRDAGVDLAAQPDLAAQLDLASPPDLLPASVDLLAELVDLRAVGVCGDGVVQPGEACDDGATNSDSPSVTASCTTQCKKRAGCGVLTGSSGAKIDPATGHCYVAWPGPLNWSSAQRQCQAQGGTLATLTTAAEDTLVRGIAGTTSRWIGMSSARTGTPVLAWTTGEPRSYTAFAAGEPNNSGGVEECVLLDANRADAWDDRTCGWPTSGNLGASAASTLGFVCESSCGNGVVEPGEGCDPPGTSCTATCQVKRACTETGGVVSPVNGHCYFAVGPATDFAGALAGCPTATHLATLADLAEDEAAQLAISADTWFALRAPNLIDFAWQGVAATDFNPRLYHGFSTGEPNQTPGPVCVRVTKGTGWKDTTCAGAYVRLCERE